MRFLSHAGTIVAFLSTFFVFSATQRLSTDISWLPLIAAIGVASAGTLFFVRFSLEQNIRIASAITLWWILVFLSACLFQLTTYLGNHVQDLGLSGMICFFFFLCTISSAILLWFAIPPFECPPSSLEGRTDDDEHSDADSPLE